MAGGENGPLQCAAQQELGGLSPEQAAGLLTGDRDTQGPLRLNTSLSLADLRHARFFNNGRTFLTAVAENGSVKATFAGNLNRKFVAEMLELRPPRAHPNSIYPHPARRTARAISGAA